MYNRFMPETLLSNGNRTRAAVVNVGSRLKIAVIKERIHDSLIFEKLLEAAETGVDDKGETIPQIVRLDLLKFLANKIVPNARDMGEAKSDAQQSKWAGIADAIEVDTKTAQSES